MSSLPKLARAGLTLAVALTMVVARAGVAHAAVAAAPTNDDFDHATVISATPFTDTIDTGGATSAPDDPTTCGATNNSVWYSYTAPVNETVVVDTSNGTSFFADTSAYTGTRGALSQVACNSGGFPPASWAATAGVTYHFMVAAAFGSGGTLTLRVSAALPPANDDFDHATHIATLPFTNTLDTTGATSAPDDPSTCGGTQQSVWYSFTPAVNETIFASTSSSGGFPSASAYSGTRGALTQLACGNFSTTSWVATAGVTYHIMVTNSGSTVATLTLQVTGARPPANDNFGHATVVSGGLPFTATEDVSGATTAPDDLTGCSGALNSVWFRFTPTVSETFLADTSASNYQMAISVYTGTQGSLHQVACSGNTPFPRQGVKWAGNDGLRNTVGGVESDQCAGL